MPLKTAKWYKPPQNRSETSVFSDRSLVAHSWELIIDASGTSEITLDGMLKEQSETTDGSENDHPVAELSSEGSILPFRSFSSAPMGIVSPSFASFAAI